MDNLRILIVEDEFIIASHIEQVLISAGYSVIDIIARGELVPGIVSEKKPDLILMDINLAGQLDGIETAKIIQQTSSTPVIFLTSNIDKASFDKSKDALPYAFLTKPFKEDDLLRNIELISNRLNFELESNPTEKPSIKLNYQSSIFVRDKNRMVRLPLADILYVEAERNYCKLKTKQKDFLLSIPLKTFEERAAADCFMRIHRSYLANISQIDGFDENYLFFGKEHIPMSKSYKSKVLSKLNVV
jgi:DNA-binding LytR/AlgR family response regulator